MCRGGARRPSHCTGSPDACLCARPAAQVTLTEGKEYNATVVGFDEDKDVAVLQLKTDEKVGACSTNAKP